jgi:hypothetical protein
MLISFGHGLEPTFFWVPFCGTGVSGSNEQRRLVEISEISVPLLIFAGGRTLPNDLDPDGCMVQ